jgi:transketolase
VDTAGSHGSPLGAEEVKLVKSFFGFDPEKSFEVPDEVLQYYRSIGDRGAVIENEWKELFKNYKEKYPELAAEYESAIQGQLPAGWKDALPAFEPSDKKLATRQASGKVLNAIAGKLPNLIGGAADLSPSTDTNLKDYASFTASSPDGRNFHFGIREHAMGSVLNGMALTKGIIPFGATFLIFSEYMRPPIRLAAIMEIRPIFVYTHDSIGLGEDGTTHQPVEQLISLRSIPNITLIRPADANETVQAWRVALEHKGGPVIIVLTRQGLPVIDQNKYGKATGLEQGAYILSDSDKEPELILIATGSEVSLVIEAQVKLKEEGISSRVVSMPSWELFEKQEVTYKEKVFPPAIKKRLAVETGSPLGWHKYVTDEGAVIGMTTFGKSAPAEDLYKTFGFTVDHVVEKAKTLLGK